MKEVIIKLTEAEYKRMKRKADKYWKGSISEYLLEMEWRIRDLEK